MESIVWTFSFKPSTESLCSIYVDVYKYTCLNEGCVYCLAKGNLSKNYYGKKCIIKTNSLGPDVEYYFWGGEIIFFFNLLQFFEK